MAQDVMVRCVDCGAEFEFTTREQLYYQDQGWDSPRRCKACRAKRKPATTEYNSRDFTNDKSTPIELHRDAFEVPAVHQKFRVNCSTCGIETSVPFKPDPKRPAFCKACLAKSKAGKR